MISCIINAMRNAGIFIVRKLKTAAYWVGTKISVIPIFKNRIPQSQRMTNLKNLRARTIHLLEKQINNPKNFCYLLDKIATTEPNKEIKNVIY
ncbi:MAG: hypothetical protein KAG53_01635 [Endozoicomonadaceae bacterium]|nr:hypothetical protein [Endozoicomonadaceae bacterium]